MATLHLEARGADALEGAFQVLTGAWQTGPWQAQTLINICGGEKKRNSMPERRWSVPWGLWPTSVGDFGRGEGTNLFRGSFGPKGKAETLEHRGSKGRKDCLFLLGLWTWREAGSKIYKPLAGSLQDFHASIWYIYYLLFHKFPVFKMALPWTIVSFFLKYLCNK